MLQRLMSHVFWESKSIFSVERTKLAEFESPGKKIKSSRSCRSTSKRLREGGCWLKWMWNSSSSVFIYSNLRGSLYGLIEYIIRRTPSYEKKKGRGLSRDPTISRIHKEQDPSNDGSRDKQDQAYPVDPLDLCVFIRVQPLCFEINFLLVSLLH